MNQFLITGLYRSGTTLLDKIITTHPHGFVASQPFPYFFFTAKNAFFRSKNIQRQLPLGNLFCEKEYRREEFDNFLFSLSFSQEEIGKMADEMNVYSGFWSPWLFEDLKKLGNKSFLEIFSDIIRTGISHSRKLQVISGGVKEILIEEFIPFFLKNKIKVLHIIRDPRDVITSLNYGNSQKYTGLSRSTLFNIRNWRKSAAFALACKGDPNFMNIRYEDLVQMPDRVLKEISEFLDLPFSGFSRDKLIDQQNMAWLGNSSFFNSREINNSSVGRFEKMLPDKIVALTEELCYPEMKIFGYPFVQICTEPSLSSFVERVSEDPFGRERKNYEPEDLQAELEKERTRFELLKNQYIDAEKAERWFILKNVHEILQKFI